MAKFHFSHTRGTMSAHVGLQLELFDFLSIADRSEDKSKYSEVESESLHFNVSADYCFDTILPHCSRLTHAFMYESEWYKIT